MPRFWVYEDSLAVTNIATVVSVGAQTWSPLSSRRTQLPAPKMPSTIPVSEP